MTLPINSEALRDHFSWTRSCITHPSPLAQRTRIRLGWAIDYLDKRIQRVCEHEYPRSRDNILICRECGYRTETSY